MQKVEKRFCLKKIEHGEKRKFAKTVAKTKKREERVIGIDVLEQIGRASCRERV